MQSPDPFDIKLDSDEFREICAEMNRLEPDSNLFAVYDGMSGAFKFADESPKSICQKPDHPLLLPLITVLRCLWAFRVSLVRGKPRPDLEVWWTAARETAPHWPGFLEDRCSTLMLPFCTVCEESSRRLSNDFDKLDKTSEPSAG